MGAQRASAQAILRTDSVWLLYAKTANGVARRWAPRRWAVLSDAETELRELRSAGAVFGLLDVDDEFFVIVRPAPSGTRLLLSDATAALDYDIADEVLDNLDADIEPG